MSYQQFIRKFLFILEKVDQVDVEFASVPLVEEIPTTDFKPVFKKHINNI